MKICFMTSSLSRNAGGLQQSVRGLAHASFSPLHDVYVIGVRDQHTDADIAAWQPIRVDAFPVIGPERFSFAPGLSGKLEETNPDILQLHGLWRYPSLVAKRWHRRTGKPYIVHPHGMLDPWAVRNSHWKKSLAAMLYEKSLLHNAACIRALCKSEAESIRKFGLRNPICIIPNGMDLPENGKRKPDIGNVSWAGLTKPGQKVLLYLGRIHPKKGLANLLRAWATVVKSEEWVLALAGWDENGHEQELKQLATRLGLAWTDIRGMGEEDNAKSRKQKAERQNQSQLSAFTNASGQPSVVFLGPQFNTAKDACYHHCNAFVLPSFSEGLPMVILEAWSHGKPVIMTPECNLPEGFAVDAGVKISADMEGIAHGLDRLSAMSASELNQMGRNGRRLTVEKFQWKNIAEQLHAVCHWVTQGGARPDCVSVD
jgi:glycosyltransferase involved in cell wall biosynthesis